MTRTRLAVRIGVAVVAISGCVVTLSPPAGADPAPTATDVVGVGSDVVQYAMDFLADGYGANGGYNSAANPNRLVSFDATADGNGRASWSDPNLGTPSSLLPTVVLRAGTSPAQRPNGGSAGMAALLADGTGANQRIDFVRTPNIPTSAQQTQAQANLGTPLHTVQIASDEQVIATATTTNAPAVLTAQDLANIYTGVYKTWGDVPGYTGPAPTATIVPEIPQSGAGVRTIFINAIKSATNVDISSTTATPVQQNDPTTVTGNPNAIVPFPVSRYKLFQDGYFHDPKTGSALNASGIHLITTGTGHFTTPIPYYIVFRQSDADSQTPWQPGSTLNWVHELFYNPGVDAVTPFVETPQGQAILTAIGLDPSTYNPDVT